MDCDVQRPNALRDELLYHQPLDGGHHQRHIQRHPQLHLHAHRQLALWWDFKPFCIKYWTKAQFLLSWSWMRAMRVYRLMMKHALKAVRALTLCLKDKIERLTEDLWPNNLYPWVRTYSKWVSAIPTINCINKIPNIFVLIIGDGEEKYNFSVRDS